uniref:Uncharacterized protein n=1 Tax=Triticum urartu TaxID=4572 RepID=A0A8R7R259_TRIUA
MLVATLVSLLISTLKNQMLLRRLFSVRCGAAVLCIIYAPYMTFF